MNPKLIFATLSVICVLVSLTPYLIDVLKHKTKPHIYTWLIWSVTQGSAAVGIWYGNGGWGALELGIGAVYIFIIFLLSFKFGSKNITKFDTLVLFLAFITVYVWLGTKDALLVVIMVSIIDTLGYIPTIRKSYYEPYTETLHAWFTGALASVFAFLALDTYTPLTTTYLITIFLCNIVVASVIVKKRLNLKRLI